jgi:hypothetical protein
MKPADIGGFAAILAAGYIVGRDTERNDFTSTDLLFIAALLALGFYLAVVLS